MAKRAKVTVSGGLFLVKSTIIVTNILKNGEDGESKVYDAGGVRIKKEGDDFILRFTTESGSSSGCTSRGTVSARSYTKNHAILVQELEVDDKRKNWVQKCDPLTRP